MENGHDPIKNMAARRPSLKLVLSYDPKMTNFYKNYFCQWILVNLTSNSYILKKMHASEPIWLPSSHFGKRIEENITHCFFKN